MSTGAAASTKNPIPFWLLLLHLYVSLNIEFSVFWLQYLAYSKESGKMKWNGNKSGKVSEVKG